MRKCREKGVNAAQRTAHYHAADINDKLIINIRNLNHIMHFLYEGKMSQKRILIILHEVKRITQRELTERLGIQPGSASEVLAKLENAELIKRLPSESDHRTTDVELTEEGQRLALAAMEQRNRRHVEMFSCLSEAEKTQLLFLLEKIDADWSGRYQEPKRDRRREPDEAERQEPDKSGDKAPRHGIEKHC